MKILVQPSGPDRRVPWPPSSPQKPRYFPQGKPTPAELTDYIQRRLDGGDLVQVEPEEADAAAAAPAPGAAAAAPAAPALAAEAATQRLRDAVAGSAARAPADKEGV